VNIFKDYEFKDCILGGDASETVESYLYPSALNVEATSSSYMLVTSYRSTWASHPGRQQSLIVINLFVCTVYALHNRILVLVCGKE
jgi:hypothetical protein